MLVLAARAPQRIRVRQSQGLTDIGHGGCNSDFDAGVPLLCQFALEEFVEFGVEDSVGHELASLGHSTLSGCHDCGGMGEVRGKLGFEVPRLSAGSVVMEEAKIVHRAITLSPSSSPLSSSPFSLVFLGQAFEHLPTHSFHH